MDTCMKELMDFNKRNNDDQSILRLQASQDHLTQVYTQMYNPFANADQESTAHNANFYNL